MPISFHPLSAADLPMLHAWRLRPHLQPWWRPPGTLDEFAARYLHRTEATSPVRCFIAHQGGLAIGFMQSYTVVAVGDGWWTEERDPGARGVDQFLAHADQLGQGLGAAMVRAFLDQLFEDPVVTRVQTDPAPDNLRAIRSYRRCGFVEHGLVATPDGPALLMHCTRHSLAAASARIPGVGT